MVNQSNMKMCALTAVTTNMKMCALTAVITNMKMCAQTAVITLPVEANARHSFLNVRTLANYPNILV
jgi:hypothetical protein